jgi:hypothetical protein
MQLQETLSLNQLQSNESKFSFFMYDIWHINSKISYQLMSTVCPYSAKAGEIRSLSAYDH